MDYSILIEKTYQEALFDFSEKKQAKFKQEAMKFSWVLLGTNNTIE